MNRKPLISAFLLLVALSLQAQTKQAKQEPPLVFTPQWTAQAQFAGYYVAKEKGFYDEEGVQVVIVHPNATQSSEERIRSNTSQVTTLQLAQALKIISDGLPLVNILQTSMNNALVIVSRRGKNPVEQHGAKVAEWHAGFTQLVHCMSREFHLDYEWVQAANSVNLFIAGAVDATVAMSYNEYFQILQAGFPRDENCIFRFRDHGINIQEDGLYMTRAYYNKHKDQAERIARASRRGWEYAAEHPDEALSIVMGYVSRNYIATNPVIQRLMLEEVLRLQLDPDSGERAFRLRSDMLDKANELMVRSGEMSRAVTMEELSR